MDFLEHYRAAMRALPAGVRWAEANIKKTESVIVTAAGGAFDSAAAESADAAYIRAAITGAGVAYTQDLSADPAQLILQAAQNGRLSAGEDTGKTLARGINIPSASLPARENMEHLRDASCEISGMAQKADARIVSAICAIREDMHRGWVVNSFGTQTQSSLLVYTCELDIALKENGRIVNTSALATADSLHALDAQGCIAEAISKAEEQLLPQVDIPAGVYPAVLDHSVMCNIFITSWQLFSATKYQGDASALSGRLGETIASPAVTIIDREAHPLCGYAYGPDDEGSVGKENILVDRGALKSLLHTRQTAARAGVQPTGNAGRVALLTGSIPTNLIPLPRVLTVEPGARSRKEMIKTMVDGLLIPFSFDIFHSINIASGDFSIPCRAILIKNGDMVGQCSNLTMSGNLQNLLSSIDELGSDLCIQPFLLRSYCYGAPSARVVELKIG